MVSRREAGRKLVSRSRMAEWEEPRHPGTASHMQRTPLRPTLQHGTRTTSHISGFAPRKPAICRVFKVGRISPRTAGRAASAAFERGFALWGALWGTPWGGVGGNAVQVPR